MSAILGFTGVALASTDTAPKGDNKDLVLITNSNGSISLLKRDPRNPAAPYFEAEKVYAGLVGADWPANQYVGSTHWWWTGQTNGTVQGSSSVARTRCRPWSTTPAAPSTSIPTSLRAGPTQVPTSPA